jgi:lipopolysaccharide export system permease protein
MDRGQAMSVDFYIFRQVAKPLIIALTVALLVLLIERMLQLINVVLGAHGTLTVVLQILAYLVPQYLSLALPISLMIGVMFAFGRLSRDGETGALLAAGVGLSRQARPVLALASIIALFSVVVHGYMKPYGRYAYQALVFVVTDATIQAFVRTGVFSRLGDTTFLVEGLSDDGARFKRVFVYEDKTGNEAAVIAAQNGSLLRTEIGTPPTLSLSDGIRLMTSAPVGDEGDEKDSAELGADVLQFDQLRTQLGSGVAQTFRPRGKDEREMTVDELWDRRHDPPPGVRSSDLIAEFHGRIVRVLSILVLPFLGIALATKTGRRDRMQGLAVGIILLVLFNQILDFGENATESELINAFVGLWLPFIAFCAIAFGIFYLRGSEVPERTRWSLQRRGRSLIKSVGSKGQGAQ